MKTLQTIFNHKKIQFIVNIFIDCNKIEFCEGEHHELIKNDCKSF